MAMVAGILAIVAAIIKPISDGIGNHIKDRFKYLCCFSDNVKDLEKEAPKLENIRCEVQERVNIAQNNAEIVVPRVQTWLNDVSKIQTEKREIGSEVTTNIDGGCCTIRSRYSVSKKVKKMAEAMKELRQESDYFTTISHPPPPEAMVPINIGSTIVFDSRKRVEDEIMSSLRDEGTNKVGICGMGGVGKTTMAKNIMLRAREELEFKETVMAAVSQEVDKLKIQVDIAGPLDLTLSTEGNISSNAHKLRTRLNAGTRKCLIVIDDIWKELDLEALGIACSNTCKVLITSRNSHILEAMDVEQLHAVHVLSETEAWELFKSKAGNCIEQQNVVGVARQVVDECKGLPLALITVGVALKNKASTPWWNTALRQLNSANPIHIPEVIQSVYQPLRLSYEMLESEVHKTVFLLCCLFPEDSDIPIRTLANICMGLHMYEDITSSRDTTSFLVERLKDRFLLLEGCNKNHVKMHDVVRDVVIFIANEENRIKYNGCSWISPYIGERFWAHRGPTLFPNLQLLWIDCDSRDEELEIENDFFTRVRELKVIMIKCRSLQQLPDTIGLLKSLRTFVLEDCLLVKSISAVGELVNLEILICRFCKMIESLPVEIGTLSQLRLLELSGCRNLKTIAPGIISNLTKLEELIVEHFDGWEARIVRGKRKNASLCELEHLSSLTLLKIIISDSRLAAEQLFLSPKMLKFHIILGDQVYFDSTLEKTMELEFQRDVKLGKWIYECVKNVESLHLRGDGSSVLDLRVALNLRELEFSNCSMVKNLVNMPFHQLEHLRLECLNEMEEICDISNFKRLASIRIDGCGRLRSLFSLSVRESGNCFLQLEKLEIHNCKMMEAVFMNSNIHIPLLFPKLHFLGLYYLLKLTSFIKEIQATVEFPQLDEIVIEDCPLLKTFVWEGSPTDHHGEDNNSIHLSCDPHKVRFGKLRKLQICMGRITSLCLQSSTDSFTSLSEIVACGLTDVRSLFSFSMTGSSCLSQLERLIIDRCDMMEHVILWNEEENNMGIQITLFPKLKFLGLESLPRLKSLSKGIENIQFPLPARIEINNCPLLMESCASDIADQNGDYTHLFCKPHQKVEFDRLKELEIRGSSEGKMMRINWCPQIPMIELFSRLCKLDVGHLNGMESLFPSSTARMLQHIKIFRISICKEMVRVIEDDVFSQTQTTPQPIHLFPTLESLSLYCLPKLRSFCEWRCSLQFPWLLNLEISECDMMEALTWGPLFTPNLQTFQKDHHKLNDKDVNTALYKLSRGRREEKREESKTLLEEEEDMEEDDTISILSLLSGMEIGFSHGGSETFLELPQELSVTPDVARNSSGGLGS